MNCRYCAQALRHAVLDLGFSPPSNSYLTADQLASPELSFPLKLRLCTACGLLQTEAYTTPEQLFTKDYAYFSSASGTWLEHAAAYARMISKRLALNPESLVIEIAANDGYLLRNFVAAKIPCLGIEPTASTAAAAETLGIPVLREFFTAPLAARLAGQGRRADLIIGNNVYAHVPEIGDFTQGLKLALKPRGTITLEFPHLLRLVEQALFDTVYHEHFSYLALHTVRRIFCGAGLRVCDVEELPTHGGSLRVYGCHADDPRADAGAVARLLAEEGRAGLLDPAAYQSLQRRTDKVKDDFVAFLIEQKRAGKVVAGYGAAAKGNTLLNYGGVKPDLLPFVCDAAPSKQGKYLPGSHIPVLSPEALRERRPDFVLVLPWNIADEVVRSIGYIRDWGARFVIAVPELRAW